MTIPEDDHEQLNDLPQVMLPADAPPINRSQPGQPNDEE